MPSLGIFAVAPYRVPNRPSPAVGRGGAETKAVGVAVAESSLDTGDTSVTVAGVASRPGYASFGDADVSDAMDSRISPFARQSEQTCNDCGERGHSSSDNPDCHLHQPLNPCYSCWRSFASHVCLRILCFSGGLLIFGSFVAALAALLLVGRSQRGAQAASPQQVRAWRTAANSREKLRVTE